MPAKYLPLIASYEARIDKAFAEGDIPEALHLLDRLKELPNMPDFPDVVAPRLKEVMEKFDLMRQDPGNRTSKRFGAHDA
jgi:hypothetical protein